MSPSLAIRSLQQLWIELPVKDAFPTEYLLYAEDVIDSRHLPYSLVIQSNAKLR